MNLSLVEAHQATLRKECTEQLRVICPLYAVIVLEQSSYNQAGMRPQLRQDTLFYEALYRVCTPQLRFSVLLPTLHSVIRNTCAKVRWSVQASTEVLLQSRVTVKLVTGDC